MRKKGAKVGDNVTILNSHIDLAHPCLIEIGDDVTITGATILTHDACLNKPLNIVKYGKVKIGNNCFIAKNSIILSGTKIGNNVIVGAGCVVAKNVPDNVVVVGNPMRILYSYDEFLKKNYDLMEKSQIIEIDSKDVIDDNLLLQKIEQFDICYVRKA